MTGFDACTVATGGAFLGCTTTAVGAGTCPDVTPMPATGAIYDGTITAITVPSGTAAITDALS